MVEGWLNDGRTGEGGVKDGRRMGEGWAKDEWRGREAYLLHLTKKNSYGKNSSRYKYHWTP